MIYEGPFFFFCHRTVLFPLILLSIHGSQGPQVKIIFNIHFLSSSSFTLSSSFLFLFSSPFISCCHLSFFVIFLLKFSPSLSSSHIPRQYYCHLSCSHLVLFAVFLFTSFDIFLVIFLVDLPCHILCHLFNIYSCCFFLKHITRLQTERGSIALCN